MLSSRFRCVYWKKVKSLITQFLVHAHACLCAEHMYVCVFVCLRMCVCVCVIFSRWKALDIRTALVWCACEAARLLYTQGCDTADPPRLRPDHGVTSLYFRVKAKLKKNVSEKGRRSKGKKLRGSDQLTWRKSWCGLPGSFCKHAFICDLSTEHTRTAIELKCT